MKGRVKADKQTALHGVILVIEEAVTSKPVEDKDDPNMPLAHIINVISITDLFVR